MMMKMRNAPLYVDASALPGGQLPRLAYHGDLGYNTHGDFEFGPSIGALKLDFLLMVCARVATGCCAPEDNSEQ